MKYFFKKISLTITLLSSLVLSGCVGLSGDNLSAVSGLISAPDVSLVSINPKGYKDGNLDFDITLKVGNANLLPMLIKDMNANIDLNGVNLFNINEPVGERVEKNNNGNITLSSQLSKDKVSQLTKTLTRSKINYAINGDVGLLGGLTRLPIQNSGSIDVKDLLVKVVKAQLSR